MNPGAVHLNTANPPHTRHCPSPMAEAKHAALADAIALACSMKINPQLAALTATVAALEAKVTVFEQIAAGSVTPAKRTTRATKPASTKGGAAKSGNKTEEEKVTNALLFFRYAMKNDYENFRETYANEDAIATVAGEAAVAKKDAIKEKDPGDYYSTVGAALWKKMAETDRAGIRALYIAWSQAQTRENDATPLEEEAEADAEA